MSTVRFSHEEIVREANLVPKTWLKCKSDGEIIIASDLLTS